MGLLPAIAERAHRMGAVALVKASEAAGPTPGRLGRQLPAGHAAGVEPVVLTGGYATTPSIWSVWERSLRADGLSPSVFRLPDHGFGDIEQTARALAGHVDAVRAATGSERVHLVGYSEGGLISRSVDRLLGHGEAIASITTVATPNRGISFGAIPDALVGVRLIRDAMPTAARQMQAGSEFMGRLDAPSSARHRIPLTSIYTRAGDGMVIPASSPVLEGARNVPIEGGLRHANHLAIVRRNADAYEAARAAVLAAGRSVD